MEKEKYTKPTLETIELNADIILASGCVDDCVQQQEQTRSRETVCLDLD